MFGVESVYQCTIPSVSSSPEMLAVKMGPTWLTLFVVSVTPSLPKLAPVPPRNRLLMMPLAGLPGPTVEPE